MKKRIAAGMMLTVAGALLVSALAFGGSPNANSKAPGVKKFSAALNVGQETGVVKATKRGAAGRFTATLSGTTLTFQLTFSHLSGDATAAHIHAGARHVSGAVLVPLCGPCTSPVKTSVTLTQDQINQMEAGKTYVNVHTAKNPGGEIRGQVVAVR